MKSSKKTESVPQPRVVEITDVILRDAHQSLMATRMAMEDMVPACADLDECGFWSLECWGGATFDACIRFLNEDPWERLRTFRRLLPKTKLQMLLRGQNLLGYRHYADDVVDRFVAKAASNGMDVFRVFDALNDIRNLQTSVKAVKKQGKHAQGTISYTISPLHTTKTYVDFAKRLQDMGADSLCIKDMAALLKPQAAFDLVKGIKDACGDKLQVHLHVHATSGVTMVSTMKAIEAGCDIVDASNSAMCLGSGHNPVEAVCAMLDGTPFTHRVNLERVKKVRHHFEKMRVKYAEHYTKFTGIEADIFESQIPGGMLSNLESQLKQQGAGDRMAEVMAEIPKVRKDAGYPPLVTPSSQIVGSQAVFNVLMGRYKKLTAEFSDIMLGYYGTTIGEKAADVVKIAQEQSGKKLITCRPADLIKNEWDELAGKARAMEGYNGSDEDTLTLAMFPQIAPKFFKERPQGPKSPISAAAPKAAVPVQAVAAVAEAGPRRYNVTVNGQVYQVDVAQGDKGPVATPVGALTAKPAPVRSAPTAALTPTKVSMSSRPSTTGGGELRAELAGTVLRLTKKPGDQIQAEDTVIIIEAMKMETEVGAPRPGVIKEYLVKEGDAVKVGDLLAIIA